MKADVRILSNRAFLTDRLGAICAFYAGRFDDLHTGAQSVIFTQRMYGRPTNQEIGNVPREKRISRFSYRETETVKFQYSQTRMPCEKHRVVLILLNKSGFRPHTRNQILQCTRIYSSSRSRDSLALQLTDIFLSNRFFFLARRQYHVHTIGASRAFTRYMYIALISP